MKPVVALTDDERNVDFHRRHARLWMDYWHW